MPAKSQNQERRPRATELKAECAIAPAIRVEPEAIVPLAPLTQPEPAQLCLLTPANATVKVRGGFAGLPKLCSRHGLDEGMMRRMLEGFGSEHRGWRVAHSALENEASKGVLHVCDSTHAGSGSRKRLFHSVWVAGGSTGGHVQASVRRKLGFADDAEIVATELLGVPAFHHSYIGWDEIAKKLKMPGIRITRLDIREI